MRVDPCDGENIRDFHRAVLPRRQSQFWPEYFCLCRLWAGLGAYHFTVHQKVIDLLKFFYHSLTDRLQSDGVDFGMARTLFSSYRGTNLALKLGKSANSSESTTWRTATKPLQETGGTLLI